MDENEHMRKSVVDKLPIHTVGGCESCWLKVEDLAAVEVTSEDPNFPIESALTSGHQAGWRAGQQGLQVIRLVFDEPQTLHRIRLQFSETQIDRTQEFTLRWSNDGGRTFHEIVRQQWNFSPAGCTSEIEDYQIKLNGVSVMELAIKPEVTHGKAVATLESWRVA